MRIARAIALLPAFILLIGATAQSGCVPEKPGNEDHLVFQYTPFLSNEEVAQLDKKLVDFARATSNQIAVLIVDTLCGDAPFAFAHEVMRQWGIGKAKDDNGIVLLVKPTGASSQRAVFIATGAGLEGAIPDAAAGRIVRETLIPNFKEGKSFAGLDAATDELMRLAQGEYDTASPDNAKGVWPMVLVIFVIIIISVIGTYSRAKRYASTNKTDLWTALWLLNQAGRRHGGSWGGFTGGGGSWGGGGGGGFGGFGGGIGRGGGAGGSW